MVNVDPIDILLVEDNPNDLELALRALKRHNLANSVVVVIGSKNEDNENLYYVKDNGVGFDMKYGEKIRKHLPVRR